MKVGSSFIQFRKSNDPSLVFVHDTTNFKESHGQWNLNSGKETGKQAGPATKRNRWREKRRRNEMKQKNQWDAVVSTGEFVQLENKHEKLQAIVRVDLGRSLEKTRSLMVRPECFSPRSKPEIAKVDEC